MFVDRVKIKVKGGKGGKGCVCFRRERFIPKGGPDGGDGAEGGSVYIEANENKQCLEALKYMNHYEAENGRPGSGNKRHGKRGEDTVIPVPVGTIITKEGEPDIHLADLDIPGSRYLAAAGGKGGKGNFHFKSSTNQYPRLCQPGLEGEERALELELKIIADIGLVGYPNVGKSTFLSVVTDAKPKTAPYPFTTLNPHVGIVEFDDFFRMSIADIPGLIDNAHNNVGLGHEFLRHIERTRVLAYILDIGACDGLCPVEQLKSLQQELEYYQKDLTQRPSIIIANKMDIENSSDNLRELTKNTKLQIFPISAILEDNIPSTLDTLRGMLENPAKNSTLTT